MEAWSITIHYLLSSLVQVRAKMMNLNQSSGNPRDPSPTLDVVRLDLSRGRWQDCPAH